MCRCDVVDSIFIYNPCQDVPANMIDIIRLCNSGKCKHECICSIHDVTRDSMMIYTEGE